MTAQQQEPTMREEIARWLFEDRNLPRFRWDDCPGLHDIWLEKADGLRAVLERRGDGDAARVRRVRELADTLAQERHRVPEIPRLAAAERIRHALDGDGTGGGQ